MNRKLSKLTAAALLAGLLGLWLRLTLYRTGFDEKNILSSSHPLHLACLGLTLLLAVYLVFALRSADTAATRCPALIPLAMIAGAVLTMLHGMDLLRESFVPLDTARWVLAFGCTVSMGLCALPGMGHRIRTAALGIITVFYALDMLCRYQGWSCNPQLPDYCFQVFACVLLSLCSYHRLALVTGLGRPRGLLFCGLMGLTLCLFCAAGPETKFFYLGGACWAGSCLFTPQPPAEKQEDTDVPA